MICSLGMRKNSMGRNVLANKFDQAEFGVIFKPQKTHEERTVGELPLRKSLKQLQRAAGQRGQANEPRNIRQGEHSAASD